MTTMTMTRRTTAVTTANTMSSFSVPGTILLSLHTLLYLILTTMRQVLFLFSFTQKTGTRNVK